ncbi:hypothetical protein [Lentibacillus salinarum]|uniref:Uncharacterized protein n=1 Tax=Lentibacillus salinarum TaxID=446820 RepID=A0ABW3ZRG9_9BACI
MTKITKERFLEILEVLNERLEENKLSMSLNIYGGTVMMACFDVRPATKDIDEIFETFPQIKTILNDIAETYGLDENWINQDIQEPLKHVKHEHLKETYTYNYLKVFTPKCRSNAGNEDFIIKTGTIQGLCRCRIFD